VHHTTSLSIPTIWPIVYLIKGMIKLPWEMAKGSNTILLEGSVGPDGLYKFMPFEFNPTAQSSPSLHLNKTPSLFSSHLSALNKNIQCNNALTIGHVDNTLHTWHLRLHAPLSTTIYTKPFEVIHCDLWGPAPFKSYYGYNYYITFVDTYTKYTWFYLLNQKSDALKAFTQFLKLIQNQYQTSVKAVQSDWGGEFRPFTAMLNTLGIQHRLTCPHTSHQNGTVERKHRQIVEMGLTLLSQASLPLHFWDHSFTHAVHLINKLPSSALSSFKSPHHALFDSCPDYTQLRVTNVLMPMAESTYPKM
ncbi:retrovirus-related Pol polyprotein from transposon TNT 1-94, partial [Trifolium pratense]